MKLADLVKALNVLSDEVNSHLNDLLAGGQPEELYSASSHLIEAGGKRIRPFIVLQSCKMVGGEIEEAIHELLCGSPLSPGCAESYLVYQY